MARTDPTPTTPAEGDKRAAVAAAALEDLNGGSPSATPPPGAVAGTPVELFDAAAFASNLTDTAHAVLLLVSFVLAKRGKGEFATKLVSGAPQLAQGIGSKAALLLQGRGASVLVWTGLVGGMLAPLIQGLTLEAAANPPAPKPQPAQSAPVGPNQSAAL